MVTRTHLNVTNAYVAYFVVFHFDPQRTQCLLLKTELQCLVVLSAGKFL